MEDRDSSDEVIIAKYIDELALAGAIQQNLYDMGDAPTEQRLANLQNGHIIDRYIHPSRTQSVKRDHHAKKERIAAARERAGSSDNPSHHNQQSGHGNSSNGGHHHQDTDLAWLDEPQTLYLKRKLHVHDSVTFVHNLAQMLSSSCVRDAMKKVKLVYDLVASANKATYPVFAIDCEGKVIAWNRAMEQVTGMSAHEMIGRGDYAYAIPFYGTPRPMLIDYLILPFPRADNIPANQPIGKRDVLSSKAETVWIHGRPQIIWGRGTRIYDEDGTIVGAVQSVGIRDPHQDTMQTEKEKSVAECIPAKEIPAVSPPLAIPSSPYLTPSGPAHREERDIGLPAGAIQDLELQGLFLNRRHENLRNALNELIEKEDDLLRVLSSDPRPLREEVQVSKPSDDLFKQVILDAREGVIAYDRTFACILWNPFMEQLTGVPAAEVLGKRAFDMFPVLKNDSTFFLLEQALSGKTVESTDISIHVPVSGKQAWVRFIFSPLRDRIRSVIGVIGIVQDTTARKVMEYALQTTIMQLMESEEKYRNVFNSKNDPLILIDTRNLSILDLNNAASDLYGYQRNEFLTLSPSDLFTEPEKYKEFLGRQSTGIRMGRQRRKDGSVFPADLASAYFELKGHPVLILSVRDLSLAYQTADELRLANTKLNLLIGVTRHDIINNLTVLMGYNDLMKNTVKDKKILEMLEKEESALHAVHRQIEFTRQYYNLGVKSPLWQNICETSTRAYSQFITTISFTCDTHNLEIYADPLLEKVFYNLFDNAMRHGDNVTQIRVYCVREGPDMLVIFGDDGQGILPKNKERIFTRGFGSHTGLGLFLSREILAITRIEIAETGEFEKGARFELRIPAGLYRFQDSDNPLKVSGSETMNLHA